MTTLVIDSSVADQLRKCGNMTALRDDQGNLVGYFQPAEKYIYEDGQIPEFDEEELDRRVARWDGIPSDEVRRRLLERK